LTSVSIADAKLGSLSCDKPEPVTLASLETLTCSGTYLTTQGDVDAGKVDNAASVSGNGPQNQPVSATASASVPGVQNPALSLTKSASPATYSKAGDAINYTYVVNNTGNVTLPGPFSVSDDKLGAISCPAGSLAPGASVTCAASYTIKQSDLDAGSITNTAAASTSYGGKTVSSNQASATVTAVQNPAISLTKSASPTTYSAAGQVITYTYVVKNTGNVTLSGPFNIADDKLGTFQCGTASSLVPGASTTCTKTYTIQPTDIKILPNSITNYATATGKFGSQTVTSNQAQATITEAATAAIEPTGTTCQQYRDGTAAPIYAAQYSMKGNAINQINPGVFFYYSTVYLPGGSFNITLSQSNTGPGTGTGGKAFWPKIPVQVGTNIMFYDMKCNNLTKKMTISYDPATGNTTIKGTAAAGNYIFSVKYAIGSEKYNATTYNGLVGYTPKTTPTVTYIFKTLVNGVDNLTGWARQDLVLKR
jgi:hypothetical protein